MRALSATFLLSALRIVPWSLLTKDIDFKRRSFAEATAKVVGASSTLLAARAGLGAWALVAGMLTQEALLTIATFVLRPWRPRFHFSLDSFRQLAPFGAAVSVSRVLWHVYSNADFFVVGTLLGQAALGVYTIAFKLTMLLADKISGVVNTVGFPVYSAMQQDDLNRTKRYFLRSAELVSIVSLPALTGLFLVASEAIPLLLTPKWTGAVLPFRIMCWTGLLMSIGSLQAPILLARNRADLNVKFSAACCIVMPAGFWFGVPYGLPGVCAAWAGLYPILLAAYYVVGRPLVGYRWPELARSFAPSGISTLVMIAVVLSVQRALLGVPSGPPRLALTILAGMIGYAATVKLLFPAPLDYMKQLIRLRWQGHSG
jgi:PST family polysaccharide transporter